MADIHLTQSEAEALIAMEKHRLDDERYSYPTSGSLIIPLQSPDKREQFLLDIRRGRIDLLKGKYQARAASRRFGAAGFWRCAAQKPGRPGDRKPPSSSLSRRLWRQVGNGCPG